MDITVIIPTHNRADALKLTLEHLSKQAFFGDWEVVVVNNNCTDDTDTIVSQIRFPAPLHLIHEKKPGAAAARNAGARRAKGKYLIFIDNDILVPPDFLERHKTDLENYSGNWIVGQTLNLPEQEATVFGRYRKSLFPMVSPNSGVSEADGITGANASMPREQFEQLNGFDENFHVASGEDHELALRAKETGIKIYFDPGITVLHNDWAGTSINDFCRRQRLYTQTEPFFWHKYGNRIPRLEMVRKNLPPDLKTDSLKLYSWKVFKKMIGSDTGQKLIVGLCENAEKVIPDTRLLWRLYRLAIAGAIFRGFQEGLTIQAKSSALKHSENK